MSAPWRQAVEQSPMYRTPRGTHHDGQASDRSVRQLWAWLAWKSEHRRNSGLITGWTLHQAADDLGIAYPTAKRALARLQRDGQYVPLIRGTSCGAPGQRRKVVKSVGVLTPVQTHGDVGPIDVEEQRRRLTVLVFTMTTRKRSPLRMTHPLVVRLTAYNTGQPIDQKGSVATPEGVSRDTRRGQSDPLLRQEKSTYQVQAPSGTIQPGTDPDDGLPRDSDESLAIEPSSTRRDDAYIAQEAERQMAELRRLYPDADWSGIAV